MVWTDERDEGDVDLYCAGVRPGGTVYGEGPAVQQDGGQWYPTLARGASSNMLLVYQGWAGTVNGKNYNTDRIWCKMNPNPGLADMAKPEVRRTSIGATIVRGTLQLSPVALRSPSTADLLGISGRKVLDLHPGANDVRRLAPGVYFVREVEMAGGRGGGRVQKLLVVR